MFCLFVFMVIVSSFFHSMSQSIVFGKNTNNAVQILLSGDCQSWNVLYPVLLLFLPLWMTSSCQSNAINSGIQHRLIRSYYIGLTASINPVITKTLSHQCTDTLIHINTITKWTLNSHAGESFLSATVSSLCVKCVHMCIWLNPPCLKPKSFLSVCQEMLFHSTPNQLADTQTFKHATKAVIYHMIWTKQ